MNTVWKANQHPGHAALEHEAGGAHRPLRLGGVAEAEEELVEFAELAAGEEETLLAGGLVRAAPAEPDDGAEVGDE
jgi:hypothetical protein